jgi:adenine phosphoribosyltransferase
MEDVMSKLLAEALIRDIPDFPQPGIVFKDITPVLADPAAFQEVVDRFIEFASEVSPDAIAGIESRGFLFGAPLALALGLPFIPIRKAGKLPHIKVSQDYALEYGSATIEMHRDACLPGQRVLVVDDLLATGGTALATSSLLDQIGARVAAFAFVVELTFLPGRDVLRSFDVLSLIKY